MSRVTSDEYYRFLLNSPEGCKLGGKPTQRGIYVHGGKKVVVK